VTTSHPSTADIPNTPIAERPNVAKVVAAGCVGIFVELYDNGIFAFMATALAIVFFGVTSPSNAIALVFAGYAISFFIRPLGAIVCGILGDRIGRQRTAVIHILIVELFPTRVRYSAYGLGYNISSALFGGTAPLLMTLLIPQFGIYVPAWYAVLTALGTLAAVSTVKDRAHLPLRDTL